MRAGSNLGGVRSTHYIRKFWGKAVVLPGGGEAVRRRGGTSLLAFDYWIVAKRRGFEAQRLVDVTEPLKAEKERAMRHLPVEALKAETVAR